MKEEEKVEALQWFVHFANLDLERIGPGDRAKLLVESDCLWPVEELKDYGRLSPLSKQRLSDLAWTLEIPGKKSPEYWSAIVAAQKAVCALFPLLQITAHPSPEVVAPPSSSVAVVLRGHDEVLWWMGKGPGVPYTLKFLPVTKSQEDYLLLKILRLLDGFNQHAIRLCPGCNRWFFNATNREKRFCGNRCIWRTNTAKRRKAAKIEAEESSHLVAVRNQRARAKVNKSRKKLGA